MLIEVGLVLGGEGAQILGEEYLVGEGLGQGGEAEGMGEG